MSRSSKDGRRGGGHRDMKMTEVWSKRCPKVTGYRKGSTKRSNKKGGGYKTITHRWERRTVKQALRQEAA